MGAAARHALLSGGALSGPVLGPLTSEPGSAEGAAA